jgi:hypothetical protein
VALACPTAKAAAIPRAPAIRARRVVNEAVCEIRGMTFILVKGPVRTMRGPH